MTITRHHDTTPDTLDAEEVFRFLGYNPDDPAARAVVGLCLRYQLDPFAGHIIVIAGRRSPYVTRDGHLYLAHASGQLDGIEVLEEWVTDKNCHAKVAVWRKDMGRPFIYTGRAPLKRGNGWDEHADKKAVANAEVRALKRAFPLQLPSIVDYEDDLEESGVGERETGRLVVGRESRHDPAPDPTSPPTPAPAQEASTGAGRAGAEGGDSNQHNRQGASEPPHSPDATFPPAPSLPPRGWSGCPNRSRPAGDPGKVPAGRTDDAAEQIAWDRDHAAERQR